MVPDGILNMAEKAYSKKQRLADHMAPSQEVTGGTC